MSLIDYLLVAGVLIATLYALSSILIGRFRTPLRESSEARKMNASAMEPAHSRSDSLRRRAPVHAESR